MWGLFYPDCPLSRFSANCLSSGFNWSIRNLTSLLPVSPLGLSECENVALKINIWPHTTYEQAQYKSASFLSFQSDLRMVAGDPHSGQSILKMHMILPPHASANNESDFSLSALIFRPYPG